MPGVSFISPQQCRSGRILSNLSAIELAERAGVGIATVKRFESGQTVHPSTVEALRIAFAAAGITFIAAGESSPAGGEGVRFTPSSG
ncbi:MAG: helix-turn-helix domain-containing protein [Sphingomonas aquatilis]|uniref:helix-turn-helix domain-containing protein n=1 Tax=Sphingomonas aquatilis TaxID=93063 RepID=UPI002F33F68E